MNANENTIKPLVVGPAVATALLDCGFDKLYELIDADELESYLEGARRKITLASIERLVQRRLAARSGKLDRSELIQKRLAADRAKRRPQRRSREAAEARRRELDP